MLPSPTSHNEPDDAPSYAEASGKCGLSASRRRLNCASDFKDGLVGEFGLTMPLPKILSEMLEVKPALPDGISGVVLFGTKEEMLRVDARREVALMKDAESVRDLAEVECPAKSVGPYVALHALDGDDPVSVRTDASSPDPASGIWLRPSVAVEKSPMSLSINHGGILA